MKKTRSLRLIYGLVTCALMFSACSVSSTLPEDASMLNKVRVISDGKYHDISTIDMKDYVRQKGNSRWLSLVKVPLGIYALGGRDSSWVGRSLRKMGESPVVFDTLAARLTCEDLQLALQNKGYLDAQVELYVDRRNRKTNAIYVLHPGPSYCIDRLKTDIRDSVIAGLLSDYRLEVGNGVQFSAELLNSERNKVTQFLQNQGYFRFHKEFITYSAQKDEKLHKVFLTMTIHPYRSGDEGRDTLHSRYWIRKLSFQSGSKSDSAIHLRNQVLKENTFIKAGALYSAKDLQNTYMHFGRLYAVKYTNISYEPVADTTLLDARIMIQTNKTSTISFQPEGTNTAGDLGAAASLTYQNRNLFRGSEMFSMQLRGAYEAIRGLEGYSNQDYLEYSVESRLSFPRFIAPFLSTDLRRRIIATSEVSLLYDSQDRPEFHRRVLSAGWNYQWKPQSHNGRYRIDLLGLNYVFMPWISETFKREYLDDISNSNVILRFNYEDLFIMKTGFGYAFSNNWTAFKANVETAGNLLDIYTHTFGGGMNDFGQYEVFNIAFAQYVKTDLDFTQRLFGGYRDHLVFHLGMGIAYPYGNSKVLPFEKRYFSGGANSVRGWSVRSLGPGCYKDKDGRINFITQTGDMKLDLNLEYRSHIFWKFHGAAFVDAGNIWTLRKYDEQPGGQFKFSHFLKDLAVSYGAGLRLNFDYFILRFDFGMKAINPAFQTEDEAHYPLIHPDFGRDFAFHFAVGLPF